MATWFSFPRLQTLVGGEADDRHLDVTEETGNLVTDLYNLCRSMALE